MILAQFEVHHLVLQLKNSAHHTIKNVAEDAPLLWVNDLVVGLLQTTEDLNVLDVHGRQQLERSDAVLQDIKPPHQGLFRHSHSSILRAIRIVLLCF